MNTGKQNKLGESKMKMTINLNQFRDTFKAMNRDYYTYEGYEIIFDHLESFEDDTGEQMELDVIAICGEFSEYTEQELVNTYGLDNTFKNMSESIRERVIGETETTIILRD